MTDTYKNLHNAKTQAIESNLSLENCLAWTLQDLKII